MIKLEKLTDKDIGRWVIYSGSGGEVEIGRIKGWNGKYIFVVYKCNNEWSRFQDFTAAATRPIALRFTKRRKI